MFNIGLTEGPYERDGATTQKLDIDKVLCVLPEGHRHCARPILEPADVGDVEFVSFSQDDPPF